MVVLLQVFIIIFASTNDSTVFSISFVPVVGVGLVLLCRTGVRIIEYVFDSVYINA